jgi:hypothetical protein
MGGELILSYRELYREKLIPSIIQQKIYKIKEVVHVNILEWP